jgi:hypothetical protein
MNIFRCSAVIEFTSPSIDGVLGLEGLFSKCLASETALITTVPFDAVPTEATVGTLNATVRRPTTQPEVNKQARADTARIVKFFMQPNRNHWLWFDNRFFSKPAAITNQNRFFKVRSFPV